MTHARTRGAIPLKALGLGVILFALVWTGCWFAGRRAGQARARAEYEALFPDLRAAVADLQAQRDALRTELALLERQKADWQLDNSQRSDLEVVPGGYGVFAPDEGAEEGAEPGAGPGTLFREIPVHPCLRPDFREALGEWRAWAEAHPDEAREALADLPPEDLRPVREELRQVLQELDARIEP